MFFHTVGLLNSTFANHISCQCEEYGDERQKEHDIFRVDNASRYRVEMLADGQISEESAFEGSFVFIPEKFKPGLYKEVH